MIVWYSLLGLVVLWVLYLASMNLMRAKAAGTISKTATVLGYPVVGAGLALDFVFNLTIFSILFVDPPQEKTITVRLRRLAGDDGWRGRFARWFARELLDPFDPSGKHV